MKITKSQLKRIIKEELENTIRENFPPEFVTGSQPDGDGTLEEEIFAPSHYCVHHGGVQMEGKIKLGKVVSHNWNKKLQKITKYDMQFKDGTIIEGVDAADVFVTDASLDEDHPGHSAKRDDDEYMEDEQDK